MRLIVNGKVIVDDTVQPTSDGVERMDEENKTSVVEELRQEYYMTFINGVMGDIERRLGC